MWHMEHGDIPHGLYVLHICDNPICVNPKHLYLGSAADNARDRDSRGRHQTRVLSDAQVVEIRRRAASGSEISFLAEEYRVHSMTIYNICRGKSHRGGRKGKLTNLQKFRMADVYTYGNHTYRSLSLMYHTSFTTIWKVLKSLEK